MERIDGETGDQVEVRLTDTQVVVVVAERGATGSQQARLTPAQAREVGQALVDAAGEVERLGA